MDIVRRNTDYALRAMVYLAGHYGNEAVSAREAARDGDIPYQLACKILQRLNKAGLVKSSMGVKGGFRLSKEPSRISLLKIIETIQGPVRLNRCLLSANGCPLQRRCPVKPKLAKLQKSLSNNLDNIMLNELTKKGRAKAKNVRRKK